MFNNNPNFNQFNQFNAGAYIPQQQPVEMKSTLTNEYLAILKQNGAQTGGFFKAPSDVDTAKAICNHKLNGKFTLQELGGGRYRCTTCGEEFTLVDPDNLDEVSDVCQKALDIFNSIKTYYGEANEEVCKIYPSINIIKQLPRMFKCAGNYIKNIMPQNNMGYSNNWGTPSNMYYNMTNGAGIPGMSNDDVFNPYYGQPAPAPNYAPQPQYYGAPQNPQYGYGYPQQAGINYQQPVAPQQNVAPAYGQQPQYNQPAQYAAAANPIGSPMAQQNVAPAPAQGPTATSNVTVGTGQQPVPVCTFSA